MPKEWLRTSPKVLPDAAKGAAVQFYLTGTDTFLEDMIRNADGVLYFDEGPRATMKLISKAYPKRRRARLPRGLELRAA